MFEYLLEPFLAQYYLLEAICGDLLTEQEQEKMFRELARVFCISREEGLEEYYRASRSEQFRAIDDITSYERLCRTIEFAHRVGQEVTLTARDRLMLRDSAAIDWGPSPLLTELAPVLSHRAYRKEYRD